jgi:hypothetical protein
MFNRHKLGGTELSQGATTKSVVVVVVGIIIIIPYPE